MLNADDRWGIYEVLSLHGHLSDGGHLDRLGELFTTDVVYDMRGVGMGMFEGLDVVRGAARQMQDAAVGPLAHHVTNVLVTAIDGDTAAVESKGLMVMRDGGLESVLHRDTVRRHENGWRIAHRIISPLAAPAGAAA